MESENIFEIGCLVEFYRKMRDFRQVGGLSLEDLRKKLGRDI
jgi:hypothetical protein